MSSIRDAQRKDRAVLDEKESEQVLAPLLKKLNEAPKSNEPPKRLPQLDEL